MRRFAWFVALVILVLGWSVAAQDGFTFGGRVSATEQEAQEGYFAVDQETMIVARPGSDLHKYLKGKVGRRIHVAISVDADSE